MIHSLTRRHRQRVSAEQVEGVRVGDARALDVDFTEREIAQLVLDLRHQLTVMTLCVDAIRDGMADCPADRLSELQRSAELALRLIDALLIDGPPRSFRDGYPRQASPAGGHRSLSRSRSPAGRSL
jgi:hypothetical protein